MHKSTESTTSGSSSPASPSVSEKYGVTLKVGFDKGFQIYLDGDQNSTVLDLKGEIERKTGVLVAQQRLIICGVQLKDEYPLKALELNTLSNMNLVTRPAHTKEGSSSTSPSSSAPASSLFGPPSATPPPMVEKPSPAVGPASGDSATLQRDVIESMPSHSFY